MFCPEPASPRKPASPRSSHPFKVKCASYQAVVGNMVYTFSVTHNASGAEWETKWRFSELLIADSRLRHSIPTLPKFPAKGPPGMKLMMGPQRAQRRAAALQSYLTTAMDREEVANHPGFLAILGMRPPDSVTHVRILRWLPLGECLPGTASVELEVVPPVPSKMFGPADEIRTEISALKGTAIPPSNTALGESIRIEGLPCGERLSLEVRAANSAGASEAVSVRLAVPGKRTRIIGPGVRVRAMWAGDGDTYDATVKKVMEDGSVFVNWLRPAPLSSEDLHCVCDVGGDDTMHRLVSRAMVVPLEVGPEE
mmetsp:Transcript_46475/g.92288  ORF Transcript_46475/g.92288 Transcript_46475/m.92288 type:complete len:311 (+) Transcript_46475:66-998(+)